MIDEKMCKQSDRYLQLLLENKSDEIVKEFPFEVREALEGKLCELGAISFSMDHYTITKYGKAVLYEGGYHAKWVENEERKTLNKKIYKVACATLIATGVSVVVPLLIYFLS